MKKFIMSLVAVICGCVFGDLPLAAQNFQNQSDIQWVSIPTHPYQLHKVAGASEWNYGVSESAYIDVMPLLHGQLMPAAEITYTVGGDCLPDDTPARKVFTGEDGHALLEVGTATAPGFRDVRMTLEVDGRTYRNHQKVGFGVDDIRPMTNPPGGFYDFWQTALKTQAELPMEVTVTPAPEYSTDKVECSLVKLRCYRKTGQHYVYGYLTRPRAEGKYPVLVSPPGAGVKPMNPLKTLFYAENGFIRLDLEIHGISPALPQETYSDIARAFGDHHGSGYLAIGLQSPDTYYMKKVYTALVRAVDFLTSLPDWDGKNVMVQGNSQGGALSLVLAGLDKRVTAVAVAHPALVDMAAYAFDGHTGGYPHFGNKYNDVVLSQDVIRTLSFYDVINFARYITCPVFMTWGYNDNTCPPSSEYALWNILDCPKESYITPINEHWISTETRYKQMNFLQRQLK